jgi:ATP-binding cassette subfamily C protein
VRLPLKVGNRNDGLQPLRDLDSVAPSLSGSGPTALFDLPWLPIYLVICFCFIPTSVLPRWSAPSFSASSPDDRDHDPRADADATVLPRPATSLAEASRRNAEVLTAMGMTAGSPRSGATPTPNIWPASAAPATSPAASDRFQGAAHDAAIGVLAVGAYLVIYQQATAGIIIAGSILSARALAPVDLAIANWRGFVGARQGWKRLTDLLACCRRSRADGAAAAVKACVWKTSP